MMCLIILYFDNFVSIFQLYVSSKIFAEFNGKMFLRAQACTFGAILKFSVNSVNSIARLNFSSSPIRRKRKTNSRRSTHFTMLDRFTTQSPEGSLTVSAPINVNLKCSASYFDHENLVDTNKNIKIGQSRQEANTIERVNRRNRVHDDIEEEAFKEERGELDNGAGLFMQSEHLESIRDISRDVTSRSPLQVSLWGRSLHRVDSYSIVQGLHADTHMYVSEASTGEEAISMFSMDIPEARAPNVYKSAPSTILNQNFSSRVLGLWTFIIAFLRNN